jgi:hypothetical protein
VADDTSVVVSGELAPGTIIAANYRVLKRLGAGGFGTVYLGENTTLDQKVVIKTLQVGTRGAGAEEARVLASLDHPNVVHVYAYDERHDCIVMQYLSGRSVLDEMGALDLVSAIRVGYQAALALAAVHEKGLVHRDIKPENLMMEFRAGEVRSLKVIDFGTALTVGRGLENPPGTPDYAPPEQFEALTPANTANDIYALGVSLFVICTGRFPFDGTPMELAQHHMTSPVPDLAETYRAARNSKALDPRLELCLDRVGELVGEMMAKETKRRPDARRVAQRLSEIENDFSSERTQAGFQAAITPILLTERARTSTMVLARRPGKGAPSEAAWTSEALAALQKPDRRRWVIAAAALLALLLIGGAGIRRLLSGDPVEPAPPEDPAPIAVPAIVDAGSTVVALKGPDEAPPAAAVDAGEDELTPLVAVKNPPAAKDGGKKVGVVISAPSKCSWDDRFRDYARKRSDQLRELTQDKSSFGRLEDQLGDAMVDRDCRKVNLVLSEMRRVAGVPEDN